MQQNIPKSQPDLLSLAGVIHIGATNNGASIPLLQNPATAIAADIEALSTARNNHEQAKLTLAEKNALVDSIMEAGRLKMTIGRDILKPHLGYEYNDKYTAIGLFGSSVIPRDVVGVQSTLGAFKGFFEANAALEHADLDITATYYGSLYDQLLAARGDVNAQKKIVDDAMAVRDTKAEQLRKRVRWVINELEQCLDPLSSLWTAFGLNKPGALETPDAPEQLKATLIGPTAVALKWEPATRAEYYRVFKKVVGVDDDFVAVGSPADIDFTIENLPANATIEIQISAINNGGESARSTSVTVVTHA